MALLAVQVHSNGQRQIRQVVVRSVGGRVKEVYEGDPEPMALVVLTMARQPYNIYRYTILIPGNTLPIPIVDCGPGPLCQHTLLDIMLNYKS